VRGKELKLLIRDATVASRRTRERMDAKGDSGGNVMRENKLFI
jgi:hypothetical protein